MTPGETSVEAKFALTHEVYTPTAIKETIAAFHELCGVEADVDGGFTLLRFHLNAASPVTVREDFLNYVLELSAQELLGGGKE